MTWECELILHVVILEGLTDFILEIEYMDSGMA
jgi:hypothetical protein